MSKDDNKIKIQIREEQLDIIKKQIQTGEVSVHKEVITEEKIFTVPVTREEIVIKKKTYDEHNCSEGDTETIRIPFSEERVDISKHRVELEDVSMHRHKYEELMHITEKVKKEVFRINPIGDVRVVHQNDENHLS